MMVLIMTRHIFLLWASQANLIFVAKALQRSWMLQELTTCVKLFFHSWDILKTTNMEQQNQNVEEKSSSIATCTIRVHYLLLQKGIAFLI